MLIININIQRVNKSSKCLLRVVVPLAVDLALLLLCPLRPGLSDTAVWGVDSRVVSHSTVVQEVPGSNPGDAEKVLGSDGIICKYLPL